MAEISDSGGGSKGKQRAKKQSTKIDMTPMVDLAFLLLTFFILTTTLAEQKTFDITFPVKSEEVKDTKVNNAVTLIATKDDKIIYYVGEFKGTNTAMQKTDFKGIKKALADLNKPTLEKMKALENEFFDKKNYNEMMSKYKDKEKVDSIFRAKKDFIWKGEGDKNKQGVFAIIKYDEKAKYRNLVDLIDEMDLLGIQAYAIVEDLTVPEVQIMEATFGKN